MSVPAPRQDEGFTVVELVVAMTLFLIVAVSATFAIVSSLRAAHAAEVRTAALSIADQEFARLRLAPTPSTAGEERQVDGGNGMLFDVRALAEPGWAEDCSIASSATGYRDVTVEVSAQDGVIPPLRLTTRIACGQGAS